MVDFNERKFPLRDHTILLVVGGSRAYGIHTDTSDVDVKGVAIPPKKFVLGCDEGFEQADAPEHMKVFLDLFTGEELAAIEREKLEGSVYSLQKFMAMALKANPNILDVLFCRDEEVRLNTLVGKKLRANRDLFLSAKAKHTFSGYAMAQLKRINLHRRWLLNPPKKKPEREDYKIFKGIDPKQVDAALDMVQKVIDGWELDLSRLEKAEQVPILNGIAEYMAEMSITRDHRWEAAARSIGYTDNFLEILSRERAYRSDLEDWKQYQRWKANRNPERAAMEAESGFDRKHAAHLVRLLRQSREILETGKVNVWRGDIDREELLAIRNGSWTYDQLIEWADKEDKAQNEIYKSKDYAVPHKPDREKINSLCVHLIEAALSMEKYNELLV